MRESGRWGGGAREVGQSLVPSALSKGMGGGIITNAPLQKAADINMMMKYTAVQMAAR